MAYLPQTQITNTVSVSGSSLSAIQNQLTSATTQVYIDGLSTDQIGSVKTIIFDSLGRASSVSRNGRTKTFTYDLSGNITITTT